MYGTFLVLLLFDRVLFIGAWALPLLAYLMEKQSEYVKKMALQASVLGFLGDVIPAFLQWVSGMLGGALLGSAMWDSLSFGWMNGMNVEHLIRTLFSSGLLEMIPLAVLGILSAVVSVGTLVISIMGAVQSYRYQDFEIPLIFPLAGRSMRRSGGEREAFEKFLPQKPKKAGASCDRGSARPFLKNAFSSVGLAFFILDQLTNP